MKLVIIDESVAIFAIANRIGEIYPIVSTRKDTVKVYNYAHKLLSDSLPAGTHNRTMAELTAKLAHLINERFNDVPTKDAGEKRKEFAVRFSAWLDATVPCRLDDFLCSPKLGPQDSELVAALNKIEIYAELAGMWINQLGWAPALGQADCAVVWACDSKPYWRSLIDPEYKAGRSAKTAKFYAAANGMDRAEGINRINIPGQEADDIAAGIVRAWIENSTGQFDQLFLATIDSDWHGLVQHPDIFWISLQTFPPRIRDKETIYNWLISKWNQQSKWKQKLWALPNYNDFHPAQIWDWKVATGDSSDNLGEGTAKHMINLMHPPKSFDVLADSGNVNTIYRAINNAKKKDGVTDSTQAIKLSMLNFGAMPPIETLAVPTNLLK